jgi:predicted MFS family arabinose efflux permease
MSSELQLTAARTVGRLQSCRLIRALGQGVLVVLFSLYLIELGWSPAAVGVLFTASGLMSSALGWFIGVASDRLGRRRFVLGFEVATAAGLLVITLWSNSIVLAAACLLLGLGRNQGGVGGVAGAAEQAWLAEGAPTDRRGMLFSVNSGLGFLGMGLGSLLTSTQPLIRQVLPGFLAYRPFFAFAALGALVNLLLLLGITDRTSAKPARSMAPAKAPDEFPIEREGVDRERVRENLLMGKMALINAVNGVAVGLTSPLLVYWFNLRFGVGPAAIGPVFGFTFLLTAASSVWTGRLTRRFGIVRSVVAVRIAAVALLVALPLAPTFAAAAVIHILRSALGRGSAGARRALAVSVVRDSRRGLAGSINNASMRLPNAVGPAIAGLFLEAGRLTMPFVVAAVLQGLYAVLYGLVFRKTEAQLSR